MPNRDLEFRGISKEHLGMYFEELGARQITYSFPFIYSADSWEGQVLSEREIFFTQVFKVNAIKIRISANDERELDDLIKKYRYKTTRAGG
ncbi:hypothetical protein PH210_02735 [Paenibacillus sp. BSR1-1]|uniref:hypothetical protein n=1 Tax=Paenibacillus sp. BSR1-1 TaxID=3020845 RepID=UPI0025AF3FD4|nr:hypothetical protein [Paenibacillus sp. BSR1-1]MDN3015120.1 hypothetical protein [Paenibacillus sp. BSR1-1]